MGIKARAEAGRNVQLSHNKDIFWFLGMVLSAFMTWFLIFIGRRIIQSIIIPSVLSVFWLFSLLLFNPTPLYSIGLLIVVCMIISGIIRTKKSQKITRT